jgi:hypothetical protein
MKEYENIDLLYDRKWFDLLCNRQIDYWDNDMPFIKTSIIGLAAIAASAYFHSYSVEANAYKETQHSKCELLHVTKNGNQYDIDDVNVEVSFSFARNSTLRIYDENEKIWSEPVFSGETMTSKSDINQFRESAGLTDEKLKSPGYDGEIRYFQQNPERAAIKNGEYAWILFNSEAMGKHNVFIGFEYEGAIFACRTTSKFSLK